MYYITSSSAQVTPDGEGQPSNTRFKVVKIDQRPGLKFTTKGSEDGLLHEHRLMANGQSSMTYKRGRWTVTDFYDSPPVIPPVTQVSSNPPFNSNSSPSTPTPNSFLTTGPRLVNVTNVIQTGDTSTSIHTGSIVTPVALDANCTVIRSPPILMDCNSNNGHPLAGLTVKPDPVKCTPVTATVSNVSTVASSAVSTVSTATVQVLTDATVECAGNTVNSNTAIGVTVAANELHNQSHHHSTQQSQQQQQQQSQQQQQHHHHHHHNEAHHHSRAHASRKENLENEPPCHMENCDANASVSGLPLPVAESVVDCGSGGGGGGGVRSEIESLSSSPSDSEITTLVTVVKANSSKSPHAVKEVESTGISQQSSSVPVEETINPNPVVANTIAAAATAAPDPASGYATPLSSVHSVAGTCPQSVQSGIPSAYVVTSVAIDNKIEQAMDLVKSHLMFAVKEEVDVLKEKIVGLLERIQVLETENAILRQAQQQQQLHQQFQQQQQLPLHSQSLLSNSNMHLACNAPSAQQSSLPASMIGQANVNDLALAAASLTPTVATAAAASSSLETTCKSDSSSASTDSSNVPSSVSPADVNLANVP